MIRKSAVMAVLFIVLINAPAYCLGWFNVADATITHVEDDIYRLRVAFDWGGDPFIDPVSGESAMPVLNEFFMNYSEPTSGIGYVPDSYTINHGAFSGTSSQGYWRGGHGSGLEWMWMIPTSLINDEFGWDFRNLDGSCAPIALNYHALLDWTGTYVDDNDERHFFGTGEEYTGTLYAHYDENCPVPEPATLILVGLGLCSMASCYRRKRR